MGHNGPAPKENAIRRNAPTFKTVPAEWDGKVRGPELPQSYSWCLMTKQWWEEFRRSPQSMVCIDSDWRFLLDTALLVDRYWRDPLNIPIPHLKALASEIRQRMSDYGTTFNDRQKQRIEIISPQSEAEEKAEIKQAAKKIVNYAELLNEAAAEELGK